jgi:hypothetical protein
MKRYDFLSEGLGLQIVGHVAADGELLIEVGSRIGKWNLRRLCDLLAWIGQVVPFFQKMSMWQSALKASSNLTSCALKVTLK